MLVSSRVNLHFWSKNIFQCVEYSYIKNGINGFIVEDLLELKDTVLKIKDEELNLIKKTFYTNL